MQVQKILNNGQKFVSETKGNLIHTKVLNKNNDVLVERVKNFVKSNVGDKKVLSRAETKVLNKYDDNGKLDTCYAFRYLSDRVYDKNNKFLGSREVEYTPGGGYFCSVEQACKEIGDRGFSVTKSVANGVINIWSGVMHGVSKVVGAKSYIKTFKNGYVVGKGKTLDSPSYLPLGVRKSVYNSSLNPATVRGYFETGSSFYRGMYSDGRFSVRYNKKGFPYPIPQCGLDWIAMKNMSFKNMISHWKNSSSESRYSTFAMNMDFLDKI